MQIELEHWSWMVGKLLQAGWWPRRGRGCFSTSHILSEMYVVDVVDFLALQYVFSKWFHKYIQTFTHTQTHEYIYVVTQTVLWSLTPCPSPPICKMFLLSVRLYSACTYPVCLCVCVCEMDRVVLVVVLYVLHTFSPRSLLSRTENWMWAKTSCILINVQGQFPGQTFIVIMHKHTHTQTQIHPKKATHRCLSSWCLTLPQHILVISLQQRCHCFNIKKGFRVVFLPFLKGSKEREGGGFLYDP